MLRNIKNSSNILLGTIEITEQQIKIKNKNKPIFIIDDNTILQKIQNKEINKELLSLFYNEYTLTIGEIAALYNRCYSNINKLLKEYNIPQNKKGRRNKSFNQQFNKKNKNVWS